MDESAFAMYLPRRGTRRLYTVLALSVGIGLGAAYSHFYLRHEHALWTIAAAAIGAILGFVFVLMPGVVLRHLRRVGYKIALSRKTADLRSLLSRASKELNERVEQAPDDAEAWEALGVVELLRGEYQRAAHCLEKAAALDPERSSTRVNLATALIEVREFERAVELLIDAAGRDDVAEVSRHNVGVLLNRRPPVGVVDHVLSSGEALQSPITLNSLGIYEMRRGETELAEQYFSRAVKSDPTAVAPLANLALVAYRHGRIDDALELLGNAATLDPLNPAIHNDLAVLMAEGGQAMAAARQLARASFLLPGSGAIELNRGCVRLILGQYEDALDSFNNPVVRDEHPIEAAHNTALALIGQERYEAALEEIERALVAAPDDVGLRTNAGCLAWALGDDTRMAAELERAAAAGANDVAAATNQATAWIMKGQAGQAVSMLERLSERYRGNETVTFHLGLAYLAEALMSYRPDMSRPERQEFFRLLHRAVRPLDSVSADTSSCSYEALANIALYRYLRQQYDEAIDAYQKVAQAYPEDGYLQYALGVCLAEQALALQRSHQAEGEELVGRARELMAQARRSFARAADLGEQSADLFCNFGMAAYNLGDMEGARQAFRKMLQIEGGDEAANNLAIVYAKEADRLQREARSAGLVSEDRQHEIVEKMRTAISTALHYFHKALEVDRDNPLLHGNIGLAYMIRNREGDVEAALRHWQHMRRLGGAEQARRYEELTRLVDSKEGSRAEFDETIMAFRPIDPTQAITTLPPSLAGVRYAMLPVAEETDWRLVSDNRQARAALRLRERIHGLQQRLVRLSM
ncbi:MAG: tetratricopeptide repeat protein [Armatimonadetes bacterium]|nr:tetratricopeptide repeat protein [Armatimonadota bacterium]